MARRLGILAAVLVLAVCLTEAGWRLFKTRGYGPTTNPRYVVHDDRFGWRYRPGARLRHRTTDFDVEVAIGPSGFREQPSLPGHPPAIVVLGDSLTFGWGVEGDETFASLLEQELDVPVWNLGISGYGTDQQYLLLSERPFEEAHGVDFAPRVVIATYCGNDVEEVARRVMYGKSKPYYEGPAAAPRLAGVPVPFPLVERWSHLYRSLRRHALERWRAPLTPAEVARAQDLVVWLYAVMAEEAADLGAELVVASWGGDWLDARVEGLAGIHHLDLDPVLRQGAYVFEHDPHWNPEGHAAVARTIAVFLRERGLP
ncbi:MAG: SGNH/GDSL hydrolase family protein [Planctomycetota bacterium]|nr:SGNH/GDSL hydrolase family protein [Planctomycetota bacterium]